MRGWDVLAGAAITAGMAVSAAPVQPPSWVTVLTGLSLLLVIGEKVARAILWLLARRAARGKPEA